MGPARRLLPVFALLAAVLGAAPAGAASCDGSPDPCPYTPPPSVFSHFGPGSIRIPMDVAVDSSGNTWVADFGHNQVVEYDSSGAFVRRVGRSDKAAGTANGEFDGPMGLGIDASD